MPPVDRIPQDAVQNHRAQEQNGVRREYRQVHSGAIQGYRVIDGIQQSVFMDGKLFVADRPGLRFRRDGGGQNRRLLPQ